MKSGITTVSASVLCVLVAMNGGSPAPRLDLPDGFTASVYARDIDGAGALAIRADGTLTLQAGHEHFEIAPPTVDQPVTVMRVAAELDSTTVDGKQSALALQAPRFIEMRWNARSGELAYVLAPDAGARVAVPAQALALARALARRHQAHVALAPDGTVYFADSRAGAVWRIQRASL